MSRADVHSVTNRVSGSSLVFFGYLTPSSRSEAGQKASLCGQLLPLDHRRHALERVELEGRLILRLEAEAEAGVEAEAESANDRRPTRLGNFRGTPPARNRVRFLPHTTSAVFAMGRAS